MGEGERERERGDGTREVKHGLMSSESSGRGRGLSITPHGSQVFTVVSVMEQSVE